MASVGIVTSSQMPCTVSHGPFGPMPASGLQMWCVGACVGAWVGLDVVGENVGENVGDFVGENVGDFVGADVGGETTSIVRVQDALLPLWSITEKVSTYWLFGDLFVGEPERTIWSLMAPSHWSVAVAVPGGTLSCDFEPWVIVSPPARATVSPTLPRMTVASCGHTIIGAVVSATLYVWVAWLDKPPMMYGDATNPMSYEPTVPSNTLESESVVI